MNKTINMLHLSSLSVWDLGQNKGRVSTYLPLKAFVDKGHSVCFLTIDKKQKAGDIDGICVDQVWLPLRPIIKKNLHNLTRLLILPITTVCIIIAGLKKSKREKPDVIYSHSTETALAAYLLSKLLRSKYVLRLYGFPKFKKESFLYRIFKYDRNLALWLKADLYILTNDGTGADKAAESFGIPKDKIHFLKNGIDKSWVNGAIDVLLKERLAPNGEKIILSVSRLINWKQVDLLINALPKIIRTINDIKLVIIGDGIERGSLEELSFQLNVNDYVYFTGALEQSKILDYMKVSDIFVSMNALSAMSNPVFEAMICGKTVVALNTGNTKDLITDNVTGVLVDPNQIEELPKIIIDILNDDNKRKRIGDNSQKYMLLEWPSWDERLKYEVDLIEDLCSKTSK